MPEVRCAAGVLAVSVALAGVTALVLGPLAWWLAPEELDQLTPRDQARVMTDVRGSLVWLVCGLGVAGLAMYTAIMYGRTRRRGQG